MVFLTVLKSAYGSPYSPVWVSRLNAQAREHLKPDRILCLTDMDVKDCETAPLPEPWAIGWWSKLAVLRPGLAEDVVVYCDVDTLILRRPAPFWRLAEITGELYILNDFHRRERPGSGVMVFTPSLETERIYEGFDADPEAGMRLPNKHGVGDGAFIGLHRHKRLQDVFPSTFASYKRPLNPDGSHHLEKGPGDWPVICFHNLPKQNDFPEDSWVGRAWRGE